MFHAACVTMFQPAFGVTVDVVLNGLFPGIAFSRPPLSPVPLLAAVIVLAVRAVQIAFGTG